VTRAAILVLLLLLATPTCAEAIRVGDVERTYTAFVPETKPAPLVLVLHGNTQQGIDMQTRSSWPWLARREQFIAIFPDGLNRAWADLRGDAERAGQRPPPGTDDVAFLNQLIAKYVEAGAADPKRIYVTGVSNGGAMTMTLVCRQPQTFAAAAAVIISFTASMADACKPALPTPILLMNGTADPLVAYEGSKGVSRYGVPNLWSAAQTIAFWRKVNGCDAADRAVSELPDSDPSDSSTVSRIDSRCPPGQDVVLYRVNGGGHRMPGRNPDARAKRMVDAILGPQNHDIDAPEVIWAFFKKFAR
jgi:polyhydroxybutyrate depolymerase